MAQNTTITVPERTWTLLTDSDITAVTFAIEGAHPVVLKGTIGTTPPSTFDAGITYSPNQGEVSAAIADLWPGLAATRIYVWSNYPNQVMVSHA